MSQYTAKQLKDMTKDQYMALNPYDRKACFDCKFCVGFVNLWCRNEDAIKVRGTQIPGVMLCPFYVFEGLET